MSHTVHPVCVGEYVGECVLEREYRSECEVWSM